MVIGMFELVLGKEVNKHIGLAILIGQKHHSKKQLKGLMVKKNVCLGQEVIRVWLLSL
jgi:hypothetical protein